MPKNKSTHNGLLYKKYTYITDIKCNLKYFIFNRLQPTKHLNIWAISHMQERSNKRRSKFLPLILHLSRLSLDTE